MESVTLQNLRDLFGSESLTHVRYLMYADQAEKEKFYNIARMFRALSQSKLMLAFKHYSVVRDMLGKYPVNTLAPFILQRTIDNMIESHREEAFMVEEVYPSYLAVARMHNDTRAIITLEWAMRVGQGHADMLKHILDLTFRAAEEPLLGNLYVCGLCGYIVEGEPPESCPVCKARKRRFKLIE